MSIKQLRKKKQPRAVESRKNRTVILLTVAMLCIGGTGMLAQVGLQSKGKKPPAEVSVMSFAPTIPAKEMIYAGSRLLATEEPCISGCLVDDTNSGNVVVFNASTGDYVYCCNGVKVASGTGTVSGSGCGITIDQVKGTRTVHISANGTGQGSGSAYIVNNGVTSCQITDSNMSNNVCACS